MTIAEASSKAARGGMPPASALPECRKLLVRNAPLDPRLPRLQKEVREGVLKGGAKGGARRSKKGSAPKAQPRRHFRQPP
jgi:hypothetical protein